MAFARTLLTADLGPLGLRLPKTKDLLRGAEKDAKGNPDKKALAFAVFDGGGNRVLDDGRRAGISNTTGRGDLSRPEQEKGENRGAYSGSCHATGRIVGIGQESKYQAEMASDMLAMRKGIDRCARLVEQLLTLSRIEAGGGAGRDTRAFSPKLLDWPALLADVLREYDPQAEAKWIAMHSEVKTLPFGAMGDPLLVAVLVRNLVDNAVKYTPHGGSIALTLFDYALIIENGGSGVAEEHLDRLGERFSGLPVKRFRAAGWGCPSRPRSRPCMDMCCGWTIKRLPGKKSGAVLSSAFCSGTPDN